MITIFSQLNWLAVLLASVAHFILGGLWFAVLFGRQYASALGIADRPPQRPGALFLIGPFLCGLVTITTTAVLLRALDIASFGQAIELGLLVGFGYLAAMTVNIAINPLFPHPLRYALINAPMFVIGSVLSAVILTAMG